MFMRISTESSKIIRFGVWFGFVLRTLAKKSCANIWCRSCISRTVVFPRLAQVIRVFALTCDWLIAFFASFVTCNFGFGEKFSISLFTPTLLISLLQFPISGRNNDFFQNYLTFTLDYIVMQMRKAIWERAIKNCAVYFPHICFIVATLLAI